MKPFNRRDVNEAAIIGGLAAFGFYFAPYCRCSTHDGSVSHFNSPLAIRMEIKSEKGKFTERQQQDWEAGRIVVARDINQALALAKKYL